MKKNIVYTVVTDDFNNLCKIEHESNTDYYCFTNNRNLKSEDWKIKYIDEDKRLSNRELLIKYKILGIPELEKQYDIAIYVDANIEMHQSLKKMIQGNCDFNKNQIYFLKNQEKNCTYEEGNTCINLQSDNASIIRTQMNYYKQLKFPSNFGLVMDNIIIRKAIKDKKSTLSMMLNEWYHQVHLFSKCEQLSVMFSLWKHHISYDILDLNLYSNDFFTLHSHIDSLKKEIVNSFGNGLSNELGLKEEKNKYSPEKEDYHCHIEDLNDSHSSIARRVKPNSKVLDIGCGVGIIGELLFKNKNCINYGIEIDPESCAIAKESSYYKKVFNISIENPAERELIEKEKVTFDYIILADTLEHMVNPCEVLYQVSKWLSKDGKILISFPNVSYFNIIAGLIDNKFNYQKTGILDNTHLHFFTKDSFIDMISNWRITYQVNFDVEWFDSTKVKEEKQESLLGKLLDPNGEHLVVQNIYELSYLEDGDIPVKMLEALSNQDNDSYCTINQKLLEDFNKQNEMKMELEKQIQINQELSKQTNSLRSALESILQSKSWRITKPLRAIIGKISGNRKRGIEDGK